MKMKQAQTSHSIRYTNNIVDLEELRSRLSMAQQDRLPCQPELPFQRGESAAPGPRLTVLSTTRKERLRARRERRAWMLDMCASAAMVVMTLIFALRIML